MVSDAPREAEAALGAGRERRLHPLSWLFVLIASLREFAFPLIALVAFGSRGDGWERYQWWGLIGVAVLTGLAFLRYLTFRFRVDGGELVIRSGLLHRNVRHIPLQRIQNVALKRNVLHRMFDVAEVKLESGVGGNDAEAQMRVLSLRDAHALEVLVRAQGRDALAQADARDAPDHGETLLELPPLELVKLGLTSNRGLLLGAAGLGVFSQFAGDALGDLWSLLAQSALAYARDLHLGVLAWLVVGTLSWAALALAMKGVAIVRLLVQFRGFALRERDDGLSVERGLFTRHRSNAPLRKIQHWTLRETWLHRWLERRSLKVETAVTQIGNDARGLSDIVPIAPPATVDTLLRRWLPWLQVDALPWRPIHPRAWRRIAFWPSAIVLLATAVAGFFAGLGALALLLLLPWWMFYARRSARRSQWALTERVLAWRSGWLDHRISFAEIGKLQGVQFVQSPFDRRRGMARVVADTAGANPFGHRLELSYLPEADARAVFERVGAQIAASRLRW